MDDLSLLAWVLRGRRRRTVLRVMTGTMIPAQIYEVTARIDPRITRNGVSDVLREFKIHRLVRCHNPEARRGRLYELTMQGRRIRALAGFSRSP